MNFQLHLYQTLLLLLAFIHCSAQQSVVFNPSDPYQKAVVLRQGQQAEILCDTAYLISKLRYTLYEKAVQTIRSTNYGNVNSLIQTYEDALRVCQQSYDTLFGKYKTTYNYSMQAIDKSTGDLMTVRNDLKTVNDSLGTATKNLNDAIKDIKSTRSDKYIWGLGGMGLGAVAGIIIGLVIH